MLKSASHYVEGAVDVQLMTRFVASEDRLAVPEQDLVHAHQHGAIRYDRRGNKNAVRHESARIRQPVSVTGLRQPALLRKKLPDFLACACADIA
ncbi:hypothetical protein D3C84_720650 [compost metagenome]